MTFIMTDIMKRDRHLRLQLAWMDGKLVLRVLYVLRRTEFHQHRARITPRTNHYSKVTFDSSDGWRSQEHFSVPSREMSLLVRFMDVRVKNLSHSAHS
jgi:hypothetical protein